MLCFVSVNFFDWGFSVSESVFVTKFTCANFAAKISTVNVLNSEVVICYHDYDQLVYFQFH